MLSENTRLSFFLSAVFTFDASLPRFTWRAGIQAVKNDQHGEWHEHSAKNVRRITWQREVSNITSLRAT